MKSICKFLWVAVALLVSCSDDDKENGKSGLIWDYANYSVWFEVVDKTTGADLLDPATEGNILGQSIRVVYDGETYDRITEDDLSYWPPYEQTASVEVSRSNPPLPLALRWGFSEFSNRYWLAFGEWEPQGLDGVRFAIEWGDGTSSEINIDARCEMEADGSLDLDFEAYCDGERIPDLSVRIERERVSSDE